MCEKTVLVCLNEVERTDQMLSVITALNNKMPMHFVGLYVVPAVQVYPSAGMQISTQIYDGWQKYYTDHAKEVKAKFEKLLQVEGLLGEWRQVNSGSSVIADTVIEHGTMCDLVVVPQSRNDDGDGIETGFAEQVIMESGRPVLVIPTYGEFKEIGKSVLVAWNGKRESARAIFDAMPFLRRADKVEVSWLNPDKEDGLDLPGAEMAEVLARHDIDVTVEAIPAGDLAVGEALLSHASDLGADMLVMGAYGHSRMREFVFGGATRTILESMTIPVLMSH
ncbi:MAG TPA: universal stress protein [Rhizobiales bacterium]|nr:universal stress protein [Hyphomicrobiales bacterium]